MANQNERLLTVAGLFVSFGDVAILKDIDFTLERGTALAIVGPNGSGKSTLFRALLGLIPYSGTITWKPDLRIGYVPQSLALDRTLPLSVRDFLGVKTSSERDMHEILAKVGIGGDRCSEYHVERHILNRPIGLLSGGEFQRVLIAWALLDKPEVLLFDEPTSGVDIGGEETIYTLLKELQKTHNLTILLISHDLNVVYRYANQVLCINRMQVCFGEPTQVLDTQALTALYGADASFYGHHHDEHHD